MIFISLTSEFVIKQMEQDTPHQSAVQPERSKRLPGHAPVLSERWKLHSGLVPPERVQCTLGLALVPPGAGWTQCCQSAWQKLCLSRGRGVCTSCFCRSVLCRPMNAGPCSLNHVHRSDSKKLNFHRTLRFLALEHGRAELDSWMLGRLSCGGQ